MIRFVDDSLTQTVYEFKNDSAFTVRIKALLKAYSGTQMGEIWVQNPEDPTALISKSASVVTLCMNEGADIAEIRDFIGFVGFDCLEGELKDLRAIGVECNSSGHILFRKAGCPKADLTSFEECSLQDSFSIIENCFSTDCSPQTYADFSHRIRHSAADYVCSGPSTAMAVSLFEGLGVLGAVATLPQFRKRGLASESVNKLFAKYPDVGFYALIENDKLLPFYNSLGFKKYSFWGSVKNGAEFF